MYDENVMTIKFSCATAASKMFDEMGKELE